MNALLQTRAEWLDERRRGIGGSDVAPILGLSRWRTPLDVFMDKTGQAVDDQDNDAMFWGRTLEPVIRQQYADRTGRKVLVPERMMVHPVHRFMLANVDGLTTDARVFEAKTARTGDGWGEPGTDEVPDAYALQVQHYMIVTGYKVADIAVLIGGSDFRIYHVDANPELQADIITAEADFWRRVQTGDAPDPVSFEDARRRYGDSAATGEVKADASALEAWAELCDARRIGKEAEARENAAKAVLMATLGEAGDTLVHNGKVLATWKLAKAPARFNSKRFAASHPDLARAFTDAGEPSRRFLAKE